MSLCECNCADTMADVNVNVNAPTEQAHAMALPTRTDDQIPPRSRWMPIGKRNCYLDVVNSQSNPIYKIDVDILKHTNFFRAFTTSSTIPSIYIQQFWGIIRYDKTTGSYSSQLDEQWFDLNKDTLRDALQITPVNNNQSFSSPPTPDVLIKFVNNLGYLKVVRTLSDVVTNDMFQPWRALTTIINLCLIGKTLGEYVGRIHPIHPYFHRRQKESGTAYSGKEERSHPFIVIPSASSALHLPNEEPVLGYLKFSAKGTKMEVFGMPIPNNLITADIQREQYYNAYLEKAPSPAKRSKAGKVAKKRKPKSPLQLIDECVDKGVPENEPMLDDDKADLQKAVEESLKDVHAAHQGPLPPVTPKKKSPAGQYIFQRYSSAPTEPSSHDESSSLYAELGLTDSETESNEEVPWIDAGDQEEGQAGPNPGIQDEGQAGSNPGEVAVSQPQPSHVVHARPNLEHMDVEVTNSLIQQNPGQMDEEFTTTAYPNVQENLKLPTEDQDTSSVPLMTTPVIDLTVSQPVSTTVQAPLPTSTTTVTAIITTTSLLPPPTQPQQASLDSILIQCIGELEQHMADLLQDNLALEERLDKHGSRFLCFFCESKNQVCLLCEVILKQIPAFNFFCASLESISAIEDTWEREKVWDDIQVVTGFLGREKGFVE
ncbi:hypothetical protein Tco_1010584 [Tanacetum coccineum]